MTDLAAPPPDPTPLSKPRPKLLATLTAGIGGLAAAAVSLVMSLYEARNPAVTPQIAMGAPADAGRWIVTPRSAVVAATLPDGRKPPGGGTALVAELVLENRTAATSNAFYATVTLANPPPGVEAKPAFHYLKRDGALLGALQPRMPETVQAVWTLPPGMAAPPALRLAILGESFKPKDNLYGAPGWFDPKVIGEATLPIVAAAAP